MVDFVLGRLKFVWRDSWTASTPYIKDDVVKYGGRTYVCTTNHTSGSATGGFESNLTSGYWQLMADGISYQGNWTTGTYYKVNDIVKYGADAYICTTSHTAGATFPTTEAGNFAIFVAGAEFLNTYNTATLYAPGDIVTYGGYTYIALDDTQGDTPTTTPAKWSVLTTGYTPSGNWSNATSYKIGSVVNYGAYSYVAAQDNVNRTPNTASSYWTLVAGGQQFIGAWANSTSYKHGDVVSYGSYSYVANKDVPVNQTPSASSTYWNAIAKGVVTTGAWSNATSYKLGDIVNYGAYSYAASIDNINQTPSQTSSYWTVLSKGMSLSTSNGGNWSNAVAYQAGDVVVYSGYSYVANTDNVNTAPSNSSVWGVLSEGFNYLGNWSNTATYQVGDSVLYLGSTYVSTVYKNINAIPGSNGNWSTVAQGAAGLVLTANGDLLYQSSSGNARLPIGTTGQSLIVNTTGYPAWGNTSIYANGVYYVSKYGSDSANGTTLGSAFLTIQRAAQTVPNNSTIFVKTGTYSEVLPIVVPGGVSIVGDSQRTVIVQPANSSYSGAGNTMWQLSDGTMLKSMSFVGMTGFVANNSAPSDITQATFGGVFVGFNPASPISTKSPYVFECSAISTGGTGAMVNGAIHATGNKSMLFHAYTNINDGGVGYYISNGARAEIVSCFTYYCYFGLATASGGFIRGLNNNNSYGNYGASSRGFDSTETPTTGALTGNMLNVIVNTVGTSLSQGEYFRGATSGANGYVFTHQTSANSLYYASVTGSFTNGEIITGQTSNVSLTIVSTGNGQSGFILVANGLPSLPNTGGSIIFDSGDTSNAYVIQSVSGSYVNTQSNVIITLANQKTTPSPSGNTFVIRYKYSQIRLMGHDFLNIGTGNTVTTNYPNTPTQSPVQSQQVNENYPGRVFYVATDQSGNFYVGT